ncbi:hypothetical protein [Limosilactobacillus oris]|jgi:hypothetical protein|uniref:hypothetical protein n=1 Tax=Limosilactobacillus oris TaxID=1632 RepID=UPI0022357E97|nr:hypothetical protein [Limosilactobacillus oris]MCW4388555.1 hypothetical protein [Limosilactobacillus oris]
MVKTVFTDELNKTYELYEKKFGKTSLQNTEPLVDPLNPNPEAERLAIQRLKQAISSGVPLPRNVPPEGIIY